VVLVAHQRAGPWGHYVLCIHLKGQQDFLISRSHQSCYISFLIGRLKDFYLE
jgi:hypothetical protein